MTKSTNETIELLKRLSRAVGVTGYRGENNIHNAIKTELEPYADEINQDRIGSVVGLKRGEQTGEPRRKIMLAAHLDEIGGMVSQVDRGFLRFTRVGGLDDRVLMGQEVMVHAKQTLPGIITSVPPHLSAKTERSQVDHRTMLIDVGLLPEQVSQVVQVGDLVSFGAPPLELQNGLLSAKSMDNRASVATMIICLQHLQTLRHTWDVYAVATADEEWGNFTGATTQAYAIHPDVALVIDVTFADVSEIEVKLNEGPVLCLGPSNHPVVREQVIHVCKALEMKYQDEIMPAGAGTDAYAIEVSREGIPTLLISVPSRYMHTPVEVVHHKDVERIGRLMAHVVATLDDTFVEKLTPTIKETSEEAL